MRPQVNTCGVELLTGWVEEEEIWVVKGTDKGRPRSTRKGSRKRGRPLGSIRGVGRREEEGSGSMREGVDERGT